MTIQSANGVGGASQYVPPPTASEMTHHEQEVVRHLTAAWNAFMQLPTERLEYVLAFREGMQGLRDQILARETNRSTCWTDIPANPLVVTEEAPRPPKPIDLRTPLQKLEDRRAKQNARHAARDKEKQAADPEAWREKNRQAWQRRKAREAAIRAAANQATAVVKPTAPREPASQPTRTEGLKSPSGLSNADRARWRYNNDPIYREHVKHRNAAYNQMRTANGEGKPKSKEAPAAKRQKRKERIQTDPDCTERHRAALRGRLKAKDVSSEVRIRQLRSDPIYAAAYAAVSPAVAAHHRVDIVSDIITAVLERQFDIEDIPRMAKSFIAAHHRTMETYKTVSLDKPIRDGSATMHDFVTEGLWS